jgi:hypothetical protein
VGGFTEIRREKEREGNKSGEFYPVGSVWGCVSEKTRVIKGLVGGLHPSILMICPCPLPYTVPYTVLYLAILCMHSIAKYSVYIYTIHTHHMPDKSHYVI